MIDTTRNHASVQRDYEKEIITHLADARVKVNLQINANETVG